MKKNLLIIGTIAFALICFFALGQAVKKNDLNTGALSVFTPSQGGTGLGSAAVLDVGKCLTVLDDSPFTYAFAACSGSHDEWTHPAYGGSATTSLLTLTGGFLSNASSTINANLLINGNSTTTNATTTNFYNSGNASTTNLYANSGVIGTLLANFGTHTNLLVNASSTLQNFTFVNATGTSATTTNLFSTNASTTNLRANNGTIGTANVNSVIATNLLVNGSTTLQNFTAVNSTSTQATSTNSFATNLWANVVNFGTNVLNIVSSTLTGLGAWDLGDATSLEIPNGASPTTDATGEIAWDTTVGQIHIFDSTRNANTVITGTSTLSVTLASTTPGNTGLGNGFKTGTTTTLLTIATEALTLNGAYCVASTTGLAMIRLGDQSGNYTNTIICDTGATRAFYPFTTNNTWTAGEDITIQASSTSGQAQSITVSAVVNKTSQ